MISMFSLVAWACPLPAAVSERPGALSLIFLLLTHCAVSHPALGILPLCALAKQAESLAAMWSSWSGCGTNPTRQATNAMSKGLLRHVLLAHRLIYFPAVFARRRLAGCGYAKHVLSGVTASERGGPKYPGLRSKRCLSALHKTLRRGARTQTQFPAGRLQHQVSRLRDTPAYADHLRLEDVYECGEPYPEPGAGLPQHLKSGPIPFAGESQHVFPEWHTLLG